MDSLASLLIGILSSLAATAIFLGAAEALRKIVLPWWADHIYRGVRIDGVWELAAFASDEEEEDDDESTVRMAIELSQRSDKVSGTYTITYKSDEGAEGVLIYQFTGHVRDAYLVAIAQPTSRYMIDPATFLFRISNHHGLCLTGATCYVGHQTGQIKVQENVCFRRKTA